MLQEAGQYGPEDSDDSDYDPSSSEDSEKDDDESMAANSDLFAELLLQLGYLCWPLT
ncbi:TPA: hypothetical protein ACH3X2_005010 [Trebouxia sp. C0005]